MISNNTKSLLTYCRMLKYLRKLKNKAWYRKVVLNYVFILENDDEMTIFLAPFTRYTEEKCFCNKPI